MTDVSNRGIHYHEIVSSDPSATQSFYEATAGLRFEPPDDALGGAVVASLESGEKLGIRAPMSAEEQPVTRSYLLVDDLEVVVEAAAASGAMIALEKMVLPGDLGTIAICIVGGVEHGFWQLP